VEGKCESMLSATVPGCCRYVTRPLWPSERRCEVVTSAAFSLTSPQRVGAARIDSHFSVNENVS
jgi:hypothetical protein